ncbi:guanine deaminase [Microbulbifer aggregans]|uniref:guanine deaminase n=1 Tax=Microbulbifer aggregans TaxID=1769779 RepID=UPI001CFDD38C|nr:guanine deaminase [Microbulbifer aggregans]
MNQTLLRSRIIHFRDDVTGSPDTALEYIEDGVIGFADGRITLLEDARRAERQGLDLSTAEHRPEALVTSGFIDAHVHAPQLGVMGSYGEKLLDWLHKYTFPTELQFADEQISQQNAEFFIDALLNCGTTSAMVFTTSFAHSTEHLFQAAERAGMRLIAGKVLMDRNAPDGLLDTPERALHESAALIEKWHGRGRLGYAVTPRFAGTSSRAQLSVAGQLLRDYPDLWMQTHLSENLEEIAWTASLFPEASDYLNTYERFGLHGARSIYAHCIHLSGSEQQRLADAGASVAFCPSSNLFLGSGLLKLQKLRERNIPVALATDVGAGTSLCQLRSMGEAYKVCQLRDYPLCAADAFYMTTLGAARALHQEKHIGNLMPGKEADLLLLNGNREPLLRERLRHCRNIREELFAYMTIGDERTIERTYVAGKLARKVEGVHADPGHRAPQDRASAAALAG